MFAGLRSRWTMPASCAASSPSAICRHTSSASRIGRAPCRRRSASVSSRNELHDEKPLAVVLLEAVQRRNPRVIERGEHAGLTFEAPQSLRVARHLAGQQLESDLPPERCVARAIDLAHAADADQREDLVVADRSARPTTAWSAAPSRERRHRAPTCREVTRRRSRAAIPARGAGRHRRRRPNRGTQRAPRPAVRPPRDRSARRSPSDQRRARLSPLHLALQPGLGKPPVAEHRLRRDVEDVSHLVDAESSEETELDDAALPLVGLGERMQRVVEATRDPALPEDRSPFRRSVTGSAAPPRF